NEADTEGLLPQPPGTDSAISVASAITFRPTDVLHAPIEANPAIRFRIRATLVELERFPAGHTVHEVRNPCNLVESRGHRLHLRIRVAELRKCRARPLPDQIETQDGRLITHDVDPAVLLPGHQRGQFTREGQESGLLAHSDIGHGTRQTGFSKAWQ